MINVDPFNQNDLFYRYKMSAIKTKIEGNGNGIKTVLINLDVIGTAVDRKPEYLLKYISQGLGTMSISKGGKYIINGSFTSDNIQTQIFNFIKDFVLCSHCQNPETSFIVDNKKLIMTCKACPLKTTVTKIDKTYNLIIKFF